MQNKPLDLVMAAVELAYKNLTLPRKPVMSQTLSPFLELLAGPTPGTSEQSTTTTDHTRSSLFDNTTSDMLLGEGDGLVPAGGGGGTILDQHGIVALVLGVFGAMLLILILGLVFFKYTSELSGAYI